MWLLSIFSGPWALLARWGVLLIACAALFGYGYVKGHHAAELDFEKYRGGVEALGKQAEERTATVIATHKLLAEKSNAENATAISNLRARIASLRDAADSRSRILPPAPTASKRPDLICLDRIEYQREDGEAFARLREGARRLADEGTASTVDLDSGKNWALRLTQSIQ